MENFGNPGKVVTVVNIFDCQQTTNYDFHALKDILVILNKWDFQYQDLIDFFKGNTKFLFSQKMYKTKFAPVWQSFK